VRTREGSSDADICTVGTKKKTSDFSTFIVCPDGQGEGRG